MKAYLSKLLNHESCSIPQNQLNVKRLFDFKGFVLDCKTLEPERKQITLPSGKNIDVGIKHRYLIEINQDQYIFFNQSLNHNFMVWLVSEDFIYICPDEHTGFYCNVEIHTSSLAIINIKMKNYPNRIKKPKQFDF